MTEEIFRADAYARTCDAVVSAVDDAGIRLDRRVFYPTGAASPAIAVSSGPLTVAKCASPHDQSGDRIIHVPDDGAPPLAVGDSVTCEIDWARRHRHMRMHTALHLLCAVIDGGVTGGFHRRSQEPPRLRPSRYVPRQGAHYRRAQPSGRRGHPVGANWISEAELAANPDLVRTMSVKPPSAAARCVFSTSRVSTCNPAAVPPRRLDR